MSIDGRSQRQRDPVELPRPNTGIAPLQRLMTLEDSKLDIQRPASGQPTEPIRSWSKLVQQTRSQAVSPSARDVSSADSVEIQRLQELIKAEEQRAKDIEDSFKKDIQGLWDSHQKDIDTLSQWNQTTLNLFEGDDFKGSSYTDGVKDWAQKEKDRLIKAHDLEL